LKSCPIKLLIWFSSFRNIFHISTVFEADATTLFYRVK
jgi:hypothetical protein